LINGVPIRIILSEGNRNDIKLADKFRETIQNSCIPDRKNRKIEIKYDEELYKKRNVVERLFMKIKKFRKISTRYEQTASSFMGMIKLVSSIVVVRWY